MSTRPSGEGIAGRLSPREGASDTGTSHHGPRVIWTCQADDTNGNRNSMTSYQIRGYQLPIPPPAEDRRWRQRQHGLEVAVENKILFVYKRC